MTPVYRKQNESDDANALTKLIKRNAGKIAGVLLILPAIGGAAWQWGPSTVEYLMRVNDAAKQVGSLKVDIQALKEDVASLKQDVGTVKGGVKDVKDDVAGVKAETKKTGEDVAFIKGWIKAQDRISPVRAARTTVPEN